MGWEGRLGLVVSPELTRAGVLSHIWAMVNSLPDVQLDRLMERDGCSREDALSRLNSQIPITDKIAYADQVLDNSGSMAQLEEQVDVLVRDLESEVGWTWRFSRLLPPIGVLSAVWVLASRAFKRRTSPGLSKKSV